MAGEQVPYLQDWCREFPAGATAQGLAARSLAISKSADKLIKEQDGLLQLVFGLDIPQRAESAIREVLNTTDSSFEMSANGRELKVMSGAILAELARRQDKQGTLVAAAVETGSLAGIRKADLPVDLVGYCGRQLVEVAARNRKRVSVKRPTITAPAVEFTNVPEEGFTSQKVNAAIREAAASTATNVIAAMQAVVSQSALIKNVMLLEEELQVLWWLTNQWSYAADKEFSAVPAVERPFYFADDLANRSEIFPVGANIRPLLQRANVGSEEIEIIVAVNSMPRSWVQSKVARQELSPIKTPLHEALKRRLETTDDNGWGQGWSSATGVDVTSRLSPLALALQFFREALLLKSQ